MSSLAEKSKAYPEIMAVKIGENTITASMSDGREVSIPLVWFPRLDGIHWPEVDEDISVKAFFD